MQYQFRFGPEEASIDLIFNEPEIKNRLSEVLFSSNDFLTEKTLTIKNFLLHLPNDKEEKEKLKNQLEDAKIISEFHNTLKFRLVWDGIDNVFSKEKKYNVKENILEILNYENESLQSYLNKRLISTFSSLTAFEYDDLLNEVFLQNRASK